MKGLINLIGMSVGGWIGWAVGAQVSFFTAFMLGIIGTGAGLYAAQRVLDNLLP